jgi:DUF971 family protein
VRGGRAQCIRINGPGAPPCVGAFRVLEMNAVTKPKRVTVDSGAQTFAILWGDGHQTVFPLDGLRRACPCAHCRGGHAKMHELPDPETFRLPSLMQWKSVRVEPVGGYALRFTWDDGHDAGIYTWQRLRAMCPCDACAELRD